MVEQKLDIPDIKVFGIVFFYCAIIIALPVSTFFLSKYFIFDGLLALTTVASNVWSAVLAVISLHIALGLFIYKAYSGDKTEEAQKPYEKLD